MRLLAKVWFATNKSEDAVIQRAIAMGVTKSTAQSYLEAIKGRFPK